MQSSCFFSFITQFMEINPYYIFLLNAPSIPRVSLALFSWLWQSCDIHFNQVIMRLTSTLSHPSNLLVPFGLKNLLLWKWGLTFHSCHGRWLCKCANMWHDGCSHQCRSTSERMARSVKMVMWEWAQTQFQGEKTESKWNWSLLVIIVGLELTFKKYSSSAH